MDLLTSSGIIDHHLKDPCRPLSHSTVPQQDSIEEVPRYSDYVQRCRWRSWIYYDLHTVFSSAEVMGRRGGRSMYQQRRTERFCNIQSL